MSKHVANSGKPIPVGILVSPLAKVCRPERPRLKRAPSRHARYRGVTWRYLVVGSSIALAVVLLMLAVCAFRREPQLPPNARFALNSVAAVKPSQTLATPRWLGEKRTDKRGLESELRAVAKLGDIFPMTWKQFFLHERLLLTQQWSRNRRLYRATDKRVRCENSTKRAKISPPLNARS
jgi:hypothetical protein